MPRNLQIWIVHISFRDCLALEVDPGTSTPTRWDTSREHTSMVDNSDLIKGVADDEVNGHDVLDRVGSHAAAGAAEDDSLWGAAIRSASKPS